MSPGAEPVGRALPFRTRGWRGLRDERIREEQVCAAIEAHEGSDGRLKDDARSCVSACHAAGRPVVVKEVRKGGPRRRLADLFRGSPARRGFRAGRRLLSCGIGAALPLAAIEQTGTLLARRSLLISDDLRGHPTVAARLAEVAERPEADAERAALLDALADLLVALHREGVRHGDLRAQHAHCAPTAEGGLRLQLIDLESVRFGRPAGDAVRLADWAQINGSIPDAHASLAERRAAFERYARERPFAAGCEVAFARMTRASVQRRHLYRGPDATRT
jgi:hypothetical protein